MYRFKRVKLAWHHQNRFKRKLVLFLRFSLKSNFWKSHVAITHQHAHTQLQTPCPAQRAGVALSQMTRQARQSSQIPNVEESAGSTSMATVVWWTRVAPATCTEIYHTCAGSMEAVETWLSVEENEEVASAIVGDMVEDLCIENVLQMDASSDDEVDHVAQGGAGQSSGAAAPPPPPYGRVAEHLCELEDTAEKCGMSEVS